MTGRALILVAGTTWDYIDLIQRRFPQRALFLTDRRERQRCPLGPPPAKWEVLCDLGDEPGVRRALSGHLKRHALRLGGIVAFDCEALILAASLAHELGLAFPPLRAVRACRDKVLCKENWRLAGVPCPQARAVASVEQALAFMVELGRPVVLKPRIGTGSQGVFKCLDAAQVERCFPLALAQAGPDGAEPGGIAVEELVRAPEFSCDFLLENGELSLLRVAQKEPHPEPAAGLTLAYLLGPGMPQARDDQTLRRDLLAALVALGLERALGMADFFWREGRPCFLEVAPRPGGDCLPWVLRQACGLDLWETALDFAAGATPGLPRPSDWRPMAGLMLYARPGEEAGKDRLTALKQDARVREIIIKEPEGENNGFRRVGHLIFEPRNPTRFGREALALAGALASPSEAVA